jgi:AcrR family transcriptional regulator
MTPEDLETLEGSGESDGFEGMPGTERINGLLTAELGPEMAAAHAKGRAAQERMTRRRHPHEGLRERKKRLTRQQISDVATTLFIVRGFEHVTVAQIAEIVGVSEKTVYNYFPTKESLVFDQADEGSERLAEALRERDAGESPTRAILRELTRQSRDLEALPEESQMMMPLFAEMIAATPALRAAWLEIQDRLVAVVTSELAGHAELDPNAPEPMIAARAIVGLVELSFQARIRHFEAGLRGPALGEAVADDLERAARLLDTGLWSFSLLNLGARSRAQVRDAALAAEETRQQVMDALRQAHSTWRALRQSAIGEAKQQRKQVKRVAKAQAAAVREEARRATMAKIALARSEIKRAAEGAPEPRRDGNGDDDAYEAFRRSVADRHEAIRLREQQRSARDASERRSTG